MKIKLNLEKHGHTCKPQGAEIGNINNEIRTQGGQVELTPQELLSFITRGYTFTPGVIGGTRAEQQERGAGLTPFWISQQIIVADIDNAQEGQPIKHPLTPAAAVDACKAAGLDPFCIYKTFSYKDNFEKFRVVLILEEPLTDFVQAREYIQRFAQLLNDANARLYAEGEQVQQCADTSIEPVKMIFGGRSDAIMYKSDSITSIDKLRALPKTRENAPVSASNDKMKNYPQEYRGTADDANELESALFAIDPARLDYSEFIKIMGVCKDYGISYNTFDNWARQDTGLNDHGRPRYNEAGNRRTWDKLNGSGNNATPRTIYKLAYAAGWTAPKKEQSNSRGQYEALNQSWQDVAADLPAGFIPDPTGGAPDPEYITDPAYIKSLEALTPPPGKQEHAQQAPKAEPQPQKITSAADYLLTQYDADIDELKKYSGRKMGLHSEIDKYLTLYPGLAVLGGQASLGKTTFCINIAVKLLERGEHVLYFALEQKPDELITKALARYIYICDKETQIDNLRLNQGFRDDRTAEYMARLSKQLQNLYIIDCDFETTAAQILQEIDRYQKAHNVKPVVIIDYLQIVAPPEEFKGNKTEYIDENLKTFKKWQKNNGIFILLVSSFNRSNYYEPVSYDSFLYTSAIEYTCDYVFGLQLAILDPDNVDFYKSEGPRGGKGDTKSYEKKQKVQAEQTKTPKKVQFVSLKNRKGKQLFKANFNYYPSHDYFIADDTPVYSKTHVYSDAIFGAIKNEIYR